MYLLYYIKQYKKVRDYKMVIKIDEYSDVPIYMQIRNQIVIGISNGELAPG